MEELWKEITGTNGCYYVSTLGRIYSALRRVQFADLEKRIAAEWRK